RGRRTADRVRVPGVARRERPDRPAFGSEEAVPGRRLEAKAHQDLHRRGRRRRTLPGRSSPARRRLYRRLVACEHVTPTAYPSTPAAARDPMAAPTGAVGKPANGDAIG